jgi:hypothetical protein
MPEIERKSFANREKPLTWDKSLGYFYVPLRGKEGKDVGNDKRSAWERTGRPPTMGTWRPDPISELIVTLTGPRSGHSVRYDAERRNEVARRVGRSFTKRRT